MDKIVMIDQYLANIEVKGENVFYLSKARSLLKELYEEQNGTNTKTDTRPTK